MALRPEKLAALADPPSQWIGKVHQRRSPRIIVLDIDSSESPVYSSFCIIAQIVAWINFGKGMRHAT